MNFKHIFVEVIPERLDEGTLYVCLPHNTCLHNCACGCGEEVVTPLSTHDWRFTYDGETISLSPSIGNWSFYCRSHYWIRSGKIEWAGQWSDQEIEQGRRVDTRKKASAYGKSPPRWYKRTWSALRLWFA